MFSFLKNTKKSFVLTAEGVTGGVPCTVICGSEEGRTAVLTAGVHSREYVGVGALTRLAGELEPADVNGRVIILHCLNYRGFIVRSADVLPEDGMNLNRVFPPKGDKSPSALFADFLCREIISRADILVDLHSGGFCEELTPHVYFQSATSPEVCRISERLARLTSARYIVRSSSVNGFYGHAGTMGVPAIILERGGVGLWTEEEVNASFMDALNILRGTGFVEGEAREYSHTLIERGYYEDSPLDGCWYPAKRAGEIAEEGELLGMVKDIFGSELLRVTAKERGVILYQTASLGIEKGSPMVAYGGV